MKATYQLWQVRPNMEEPQILAVRSGVDVFDCISRKHDKIYNKKGTLHVSIEQDTFCGALPVELPEYFSWEWTDDSPNY